MFMAVLVYILYSKVLDKFYVGHTHNLTDRLFRHNNSGSKSTKNTSDWKVVHTEEFSDRSAAFTREMEIKKKKSRKYIEGLININK
jgi:putative endonuclease